MQVDLSGRRFGRLLVQGAPQRSGKRTYWHCICDCGNTRRVRSDALRHADGSGAARSCGCLQREVAARIGAASRKHNYKRTPTYESWSHMIDRCCNPKSARYADYGGRGITVCARWRENFLNFLADMGEKPARLTLERRDNNAGYMPSNCYWATYTAQCRNRRNTLFVDLGGQMIPMAAYAESIGISWKVAYNMHYQGKLGLSVSSIKQKESI